MTTLRHLTNQLTTHLRHHPLATLAYLIGGGITLLLTLVAFFLAAPLGHTILWPFLANFTWNTDLPLLLGYIGLLLIVALLTWATPYFFWNLLTSLINLWDPDDLPQFHYWGLAAMPFTLVLLLGLWFIPIWQPLAPALAADLRYILPPSLPANLITFTLVALPSAATFIVWLWHDITNPDATDAQSTDNTPDPNENTTASNAPNTNLDSTPTHNASDQEQTETTQTTDSYQYPWEDPPAIDFSDVGGMTDVKHELHDTIILPLTGDLEKFHEFDVPIPNVLFHGPPGTGKTHLARALAGELGYPFLELSAADLTSKWINESSSNVNTLFNEAAAISAEYGYAVVFVDELDALLTTRENTNTHHEDNKVVDEFLSQLTETTERRILFIGATNNFDALDDAATRAGRLEQKFHIGLPDHETREAIFRAQLKRRPCAGVLDTDIKFAAQATDGCTAADIKAIVEEAARHAIRTDADAITSEHLRYAIQQSDMTHAE